MNKKEINNYVDKAEELGRQQFNDVCKREKWCKTHKFSKKREAKWDVSFHYQVHKYSTPIVADIKRRRFVSSQFDGGWYFQIDKAEALLKLAEKSNNNAKVAYINLFEDNVMWVWILSKEDLEKMEIKMVQMQKNDWSNEKEWKKVYELTAAQAQIKVEIDLTKSIFNN